MTKRTIRMQETTRHENESLVMVEREQEDLQQHDHLFLSWSISLAAPASIRSMIPKPSYTAATIFLWILAARTAMKTAAG